MAPTILEALKQALLGKAANAALDEAKPYVDQAIDAVRPPQEAITPGARMIDGYPSMSSGNAAVTSPYSRRQVPGVTSHTLNDDEMNALLQEMSFGDINPAGQKALDDINTAGIIANRDRTLDFVRDNTVNPVVEKQGQEITATAQKLMQETEGKGDPQGAIATAVLQKAQQQSQAKGRTLTDREYADTINAMPEPQQSEYIKQFGAPVVGPRDPYVPEEEPSIFDTMGDKISEFFGNEEKMLTLALAFNSLRFKPDDTLAAGINKRLETLRGNRDHNKTIAAWSASKDPKHQRALQYYNATKDMKGAAKLAYGVGSTYGTTPRLVINPKTGERQWVVMGSDGNIKPVELPEGMEVPPNVEKVETETDIYFYDMGTGTLLGSRSKDIGKGVIEKGMAENWLDSIGGGQKTIDNLSEGISAIDWVLDPSRKDVLDRGFGITGEYLPTIMPETKDLYAKLNQIGAKQFLAGFESLKGGGQISNIEGGQAKQAGLALFDEEGKIKTGLSPDYVREQLKLLREIYQRGIARAERGYRVKPGYNPAIHNELDYLEPIKGGQSAALAAPAASTNPYAGFSIAR